MSPPNTREDPVIILSPGRSGSTLMQRFLNCSDDLVIWGEHGGFISGLTHTYRGLANNEAARNLLQYCRAGIEMVLSSTPIVGVESEWTNNFTLEDFRRAFQKFIWDVLTIDVPDGARWGFKEIRYGKLEIQFLRDLFPAAQFIFIVRHPIQTLASSIGAWSGRAFSWDDQRSMVEFDEEIATRSAVIKRVASGILECHQAGVDYLTKFEDLKARPVGVIEEVASVLRISRPREDALLTVAADVRGSADYVEIEAALRGPYRHHKDLEELLELYALLGYASP